MIDLRKTVFARSAASKKDFPADGKKQIVFAGRSNVGKSSTINALVGKRNFAKVSSRPGKTVYVNLFDADGAFWLIDLPGYGYAQTSEAEKRRFSTLINEYFDSQSSVISKLYIIVDIRHKPTDDDILMIDFARRMNISFAVIANKSDKIKSSSVNDQVKLIADVLKLDKEVPVFVFSAEKPVNRDVIVSDMIKSIDV